MGKEKHRQNFKRDAIKANERMTASRELINNTLLLTALIPALYKDLSCKKQTTFLKDMFR